MESYSAAGFSLSGLCLPLCLFSLSESGILFFFLLGGRGSAHRQTLVTELYSDGELNLLFCLYGLQATSSIDFFVQMTIPLS